MTSLSATVDIAATGRTVVQESLSDTINAVPLPGPQNLVGFIHGVKRVEGSDTTFSATAPWTVTFAATAIPTVAVGDRVYAFTSLGRLVFGDITAVNTVTRTITVSAWVLNEMAPTITSTPPVAGSRTIVNVSPTQLAYTIGQTTHVPEGYHTYLTNATITFTAFGVSTGSARYRWDMGDGTILTGRTVSHAYDRTPVSSRRVVLTITDDHGIEQVVGQEIFNVPLPRPVAWWSADDLAPGTVTSWFDRIAQRELRGAGVARPVKGSNTIGGKTVVSFDGGDDFMDLASAGTTLPINSNKHEIFAVFKSRTFSSKVLWETDTSGGYFGAQVSGGDTLLAYSTITVDSLVSMLVSTGDVALLHHRCDFTLSSGEVHARNNGGTEVVSGAANNTGPLTSRNLYFGCRGGSSSFAQYDLAEWLFYDRELSPTERTQVQQYLRTTWNVVQFTDDFSGDLSAWTIDRGGWGIQNGDLNPAASGATSLHRISRLDHASADAQRVSATLHLISAASDVPRGCLFRLNSGGGIVGYVSDGSMQISKVTGDTLETGLANLARTTPGGHAGYIRFERNGNTLKLEYWDNNTSPDGFPTDTLTYTLTGSDATTYGTGVSLAPGLFGNGSNYHFDNFLVE